MVPVIKQLCLKTVVVFIVPDALLAMHNLILIVLVVETVKYIITIIIAIQLIYKLCIYKLQLVVA